MSYTWSTFKTAVKTLLTVDANRLNLADALNAKIRLAVLDLQTFVPAYRIGNETIYTQPDFSDDGPNCSRATFPPDAQYQSAELAVPQYDDDGVLETCYRHPLDPYPFDDLLALIAGKVPVNDGRGKICVDQQGYTFWVYPRVAPNMFVSIRWNGVKINYIDDEEVPLDEKATEAAAAYVKSWICKEVDKDIVLSKSYMDDYVLARQVCFLNSKDRGGK